MYKSILHAQIIAIIISSSIVTNNVTAAENEEEQFAFPDKYMVRLGAYFIENSNTQVSVNPFGNAISTTVDFQRDLGANAGDTVPRIDAYYRFNERHRIDFTAFSVNRKGAKTLAIDVSLGDQDYSVGESLTSGIKYTLYKIGYNYSFYHSPKVELSLSTGLNITKYDLLFEDSSGAKSEVIGVSFPLPMIGLRMAYSINSNWSLYFIAESLFIEIDDKLRGTLINQEVSMEYKLFKNFSVGAGVARLGLDAEVSTPDWSGGITDAYKGLTLFGVLYF